jgi:hypothetical protein
MAVSAAGKGYFRLLRQTRGKLVSFVARERRFDQTAILEPASADLCIEMFFELDQEVGRL